MNFPDEPNKLGLLITFHHWLTLVLLPVVNLATCAFFLLIYLFRRELYGFLLLSLSGFLSLIKNSFWLAVHLNREAGEAFLPAELTRLFFPCVMILDISILIAYAVGCYLLWRELCRRR